MKQNNSFENIIKEDKMTSQLLSQKSAKDPQFYLKYKFSLDDLMDLVPLSTIFAIQKDQIELNMSENFTFGSDCYVLRIPKNPDNQKRVLYYSLLCYLFEICEQSQAPEYIEAFVQYVLNQYQVILPYKQVSSRTHKTITPMMTTNQIKSSFAKFMDLLKMKIRKQKMVLEEISKLPQIDFVFMSIFQIYMRKNENSLENALEKFMSQIDVTIKIEEYGFVLNNQCEVERKSSDDDWDRYFIRKINQKKKACIELKRRDTTQSVGEIEEIGNPQTEKQINDALHYDELINARFTESCQGEDIQSLQNKQNGNKQKRGVFFAMTHEKTQSKNEQPQNPFHKTPGKINQFLRPKRISFFNENLTKSKTFYLEMEKSKSRRKKTQTSAYNLSNSRQFNFTGNYRPWSPKQEKTEDKSFLFASKRKNLQVRNTLKASNMIKNSLCSNLVKDLNHSPQQNYTYQVMYPQKRQTLQKLTFNYLQAHLKTT